jgi:hypothetical protein
MSGLRPNDGATGRLVRDREPRAGARPEEPEEGGVAIVLPLPARFDFFLPWRPKIRVQYCTILLHVHSADSRLANVRHIASGGPLQRHLVADTGARF